MTMRKGILLAGGTGSRLFPLTHAVSKQLLPVFDKPMIFYPLSLLISSGVTEVAIVTTPAQRIAFEACLGDGRAFGITLKYIVQPSPDGLAHAYLLAERFLDGAPSMMLLGDNLFFGAEMEAQIARAAAGTRNTVFGYPVLDPQNYGIANMDASGQVTSIVEKPEKPSSDLAVTGLYLLDGEAPARARNVRPSLRGELEITDLLQSYLEDTVLDVVRLTNGRWFDTGAPQNLLDASIYVRNQHTEGQRLVGSPELAAFRRGLISGEQLLRRAASMHQTDYGRGLRDIATARAPHVSSALASTA